MIVACLAALVVAAAPAASAPLASFPGLVEVRVGPATLHLPRSATLVAPPPRMVNEVEGGVEPQVAQLRLRGGGALLVGVSRGPSDDPSFALLLRRPGGGERLEVVAGTRLHLTEEGAVYVSGHADNNFDQRRKFVVRDGALREVAQPMLLVDLPCTATAAVVLRSDPGGRGAVVAELPAGAPLRVLLAAPPGAAPEPGAAEGEEVGEGGEPHLPYVLQPPDDYLVATPFGLVGWVRQVQYGQAAAGSSPLGCLTYAGD